mgnify:CR=1
MVYIAYIIRVLGCISICIICVYIAIIVASICAFILGNQYKSGPPVYAVLLYAYIGLIDIFRIYVYLYIGENDTLRIFLI